MSNTNSRTRRVLPLVVFAGVTLLGLTWSIAADPPEIVPNGKGHTTKQNQDNGNGPNGNSGGGHSSGANGISYHGGPVLTAGSRVYYIWYGNWGTNDQTTPGTPANILGALGTGLSGSPYFNINTTYYSTSGSVQNPVQNNVVVMKSFAVPSPWSASLTDANIQQIVSNALTNKNLSYDPAGVYFVLTAPGIKETSGFCTQYCGWHTHFTWQGMDVKYAFVGDADNQCASACEWQTANSPNGNPGVDGMASVIAHELSESTTDPDLNAWYDNRGYENADKCAWTFGTTSPAPNGSLYNVSLGGLSFLIQQNWVNASGGYCAMQYQK
jgi:hypothetical protein